MSIRAGHRLRWVVVWLSVALWFALLALDLGGDAAHALLLLAAALVLYELLAETPPPA